MITANARFYRRERRRRGHFQTYWKTEIGVQLDLPQDADSAAIRAALQARMPWIEGWVLSNFTVVHPRIEIERSSV